jgi:hypothetical protein
MSPNSRDVVGLETNPVAAAPDGEGLIASATTKNPRPGQ